MICTKCTKHTEKHTRDKNKPKQLNNQKAQLSLQQEELDFKG